MNYIFIILAFVISVCIALFVIPRILLISLRKRLFDIPDKRKIHTCAIPRLGEFLFSNDIIFLLFGIGIPYYNRILYFRFTCNLFFIGMFVF